MEIEIDSGSGFCFGVTTAIRKAEEELASQNVAGDLQSPAPKLYCLGDIVHNGMECERLKDMGLVTINHDDMRELHDVKVLLRAHGEPPETYELARRNNIEIIDATCPVVLQLQKRIKQQYELSRSEEGEVRREDTSSADSNLTPHSTLLTPQIVIFGKKGHAEVLGLVGQTDSSAIVIENFDEVKRLDFTRDIYLYSQTTHPVAHLARRYLQEFRHHLSLRRQPYAEHLAVRCPPRPHSLCLRP